LSKAALLYRAEFQTPPDFSPAFRYVVGMGRPP
jgi:hypothetical protein